MSLVMNFPAFARKVEGNLRVLQHRELYVAGADNRQLEAIYLASFPAGTNPVYRVRTEHDCSCCKNFLRNFGSLVSIENGQVSTIWDGITAEEHGAYAEVAAKLREYVLSQPITDLFRTKERHYGSRPNREVRDAQVVTHDHFYADVASRYVTGQPEKVRGEHRTSVAVFRRALEELTLDAVDTVLSLIESNSLYRGAEHQRAVSGFRLALVQYQALDAKGRELYVWQQASSGLSHFRNTAIGTLVQDLSAGVDIEAAVRSFESKVAPTNYQRTSSLITPRMVEDAMKTVADLGLTEALERRFAKIGDVSVNNVLWADGAAKSLMKDSPVTDILMAAARQNVPADLKAVKIGIEEFMRDVVPTTTGMEILLKNQHVANLMSITAPVHQTDRHLFKWNNPFGWSYAGNITDSIKERVKSAGGNVTNAKLRVSLAWFNYDDLDIHVIEPGGAHIYFANKANKLDVDMNAGGGRSRTPVENVSWTSVRDGKYEVIVDQYNQRERTDMGCVVEIESEGRITQLSYKKPLTRQTPIATLHVQNGVVVKIDMAPDVVGEGLSQTKWGVATETFVKVRTLMHSPNYWDGEGVGNKHWFFILEGCLNDEPTRGIYNEFLSNELSKHRKVFEVLGDKTKCPPTADQLSGVGFSSTRGDVATVRVYGPKSQRNYEVSF